MINNLKLLKNEMKIILKFKILWAAILVTGIFMAVGINSINLSNEMSLHDIHMTSLTCALGSAKYGALSGALAFSIVTILLLSRDSRKRIQHIIYSSINEEKLLIIRMISLIFYGMFAIILGIIFTVLFQTNVYKVPVHIGDYIYCCGTIVFPAVIFSVFISTGIYLISESIDISILSMIILFFISFLSPNYLFNWAQTGVTVFSDFAGIRPVSKLILYNRILWFAISFSVLFIGFLFRRRFEAGIFRSFAFNGKNKILVLISIVSFSLCSFIYIKEPYTMNYYPITENFNINNNLILKKVNPKVTFYTDKESLDAEVLYEFENQDSNSVQFEINEGLNIKEISVNDEKCTYKRTGQQNIIEIKIPEAKNVKIKICYEGIIKYYKGGAVAGYICKDSIYLLEQSNWIFRPLTDYYKTIDIEGYYSAPADLCVITPGKNTNIEDKDGNKIWNFQFESKDMSIGAFAAKYKESKFNVKGTEIEFYYSPNHEDYIKNDGIDNGKNIEDYLKNMFEYYSDNIGDYYSKEYPLKIVEASIYKTGGHSSGNVITFSEYMVNRQLKNGPMDADILIHDLSIIAHEMSHQWWGTGVNVEADGIFSDEGFAEYFSYKCVQSKFKNSPYENFVETDCVASWQQQADNLSKSYYLKSEENLEKLNKSYKEQFELERIKKQRYGIMPLQLKKIEELQGEETFLNNLSHIYKNNISNDLTYEEFLKEIGISKEEFSYD